MALTGCVGSGLSWVSVAKRRLMSRSTATYPRAGGFIPAKLAIVAALRTGEKAPDIAARYEIKRESVYHVAWRHGYRPSLHRS
jgi:hypothetical protein